MDENKSQKALVKMMLEDLGEKGEAIGKQYLYKTLKWLDDNPNMFLNNKGTKS